MQEFVGRESELRIAKKLLNQNESRIMVIRGRRRLGKTTLAEKIAEGYKFFKFSGLSPQDYAIQKKDPIQDFLEQLSKQTGKSYNYCDSWFVALSLLEKEIPDNEKTVILFDEISWMARGHRGLISSIKAWWDLSIVREKNVLLILCGSVSTWIEKNIIKSTALYGRISAFINLKPLSITDASTLLRLKNFKGSPYECYQILSILGGVPWYLKQIDTSLSVEQNIKDLCFNDSGLLYDEFDCIFNDVFSKYGDVYHRILTVLGDGPKDLSEIRKAINYPEGGQLSKLMDNLIVSGFVSKHRQWSLKTCDLKKQSIYRINDPYIRFYLKYIKNFQETDKFPKSFDSMLGFQMETLLIQNQKLLLDRLEINNAVRAGPYLQKASTDRKGCQIDYLVQTDTNSLFLCEFKFNRLTIQTDVISEVKQKIKRLVVPRYKGIAPVLFHMGKVSEKVFDSSFFSRLIELESFLDEDLYTIKY